MRSFYRKGLGGIRSESGERMVLITMVKALAGPVRHFKSTGHHDQTEISWNGLAFIKKKTKKNHD